MESLPINILTYAIVAGVSFGLSLFGASVGLVLGHLRLFLIVALLHPDTPATGALTSLLISSFGALTGATRHALGRRIDWSLLAAIGIPSAFGAVAAAVYSPTLNPLWTKAIIGIVLLVSGLRMGSTKTISVRMALSNARQRLLGGVIGLFLGSLSGLVGLMMGSLRLPLMIRALRVDSRIAVGTNMAIGCLTAAVGGLAAATTGHIDWTLLVAVVPATVLGAWLGARITGRVSKEKLERVVGWTVFGTGLLMITPLLTDLW